MANPIIVRGIEDFLPARYHRLLEGRDDAANLLNAILTEWPEASYDDKRTVLELAGLRYLDTSRSWQCFAFFYAMYECDLERQNETDTWIWKGSPLVSIGDAHASLGNGFLAKKFYLMALCEDGVRGQGTASPADTGSYFRLFWHNGLPHPLFKEYAKTAYEAYQKDDQCARYPEWLLAQLDDRWISTTPTAEESQVYRVNGKYVQFLMERLGDSTGQALEQVGEYVLSEIPGFRVVRRTRTHSTDYDLVCSATGVATDFRSEIGRYFVCECKDWAKPADFTTMAKLCRVLDSVKCKFGILFSKNGISGQAQTTHATREQLKIYQDRGIVIVVVSAADLAKVADGHSFIVMLRDKYEQVRLDFC